MSWLADEKQFKKNKRSLTCKMLISKYFFVSLHI